MVGYSVQSGTWKAMKDSCSSDEALETILENRKSLPSVQYEITCFHAGGTSRNVKKIVSFHTFIDIPITRCVDASGDLDPGVFRPGSLTRVSHCKIDIVLYMLLFGIYKYTRKSGNLFADIYVKGYDYPTCKMMQCN